MNTIYGDKAPDKYTVGVPGDTYIIKSTGVKFKCVSIYKLNGEIEYDWDVIHEDFSGDLSAITEQIINDKIASGELSNMTIEDGSITENKLDDDFLNKFTSLTEVEIVTELEYREMAGTFSANMYFGINKKINGEKITKLSVHAKNNGVINIAVFELVSDTQIKVTSLTSYNVVAGRNDFEVDIPLNVLTDNYIAVEGPMSYGMDTNGYHFLQIQKSNMVLGNVNAKFGTANPMFIGLGVEVARAGERVPIANVLQKDLSEIKRDVYNLKNNSSGYRVVYDSIFNEEFKNSSDKWAYTNCSPSDSGLELNGYCEADFKEYYLYVDDSKQRMIFKLNDITSILGITAKSNASQFTSYIVDFNDKKLKMYIHGALSNLNDASKLAASIDINIPIILGDKYVVSMTRQSGIHVLEVKHVKTNKVSLLTFRTDKTKVNGVYYNMRSGAPSLIQMQGSTTILRYDYMIGNFKDCECLFLGDSITEGLQVAKEDRWTELLNIRYFRNKGIISGISGTNSTFVLLRLRTFISLGLKPKTVLVTIGTNDALTESGLNSWKNNIVTIYNEILQCGAVPIVAIPPANSNTLHSELADFILEQNWNVIRFDIATSLNNDAITPDANLFVDGIHPNINGCIAMYEQANIDLGFIL